MTISAHDSIHDSQWRALRGSLPRACTAEQASEVVLRRAGLTRPPIDIVGLAKSLGVQLEPVADVPWSGAVQSDGAGAVIWFQAKHAEVRKRFTIAHELGHLLLHERGVLFRDHSFSGNPREVEANRFAAALLMPERMVTVALRTTAETVKLARLFGVSEAAMTIRLEQLNRR